jgi:hypothetical protein
LAILQGYKLQNLWLDYDRDVSLDFLEDHLHNYYYFTHWSKYELLIGHPIYIPEHAGVSAITIGINVHKILKAGGVGGSRQEHSSQWEGRYAFQQQDFSVVVKDGRMSCVSTNISTFLTTLALQNFHLIK